MSRSTEQDDYIKGFAKEAVANEDILDISIEITGTSALGDGYTSVIYFIKISGRSKTGKNKTLDVTLKRATRNPALRKKVPLQVAFLQEMRFYNEIVPVFEKILNEKGINKPLAIPRCYKTFVTENEEILVFENLKANNFCLHDIKTPLDTEEIKLVLEGYSQIHALSLIIKEQNLNKFNELTKNYNSCRKLAFSTLDLTNMCNNIKNECISILKKYEKWNILEKYEKNDFKQIINSADENDKHSVIFHGDSWNNNFMFKYSDSDKTKASNVSIIDWQITSLGSPIFDLAYLILGNWHENFDVNPFLDYYYNNLTTYISKLGGNPQQVFPRKIFNEHWKKYGKTGLIFSTLLMKLRYKKNTPDTNKALQNLDDMSSAFVFEVENEEAYHEGIIGFIQYLDDIELL